MTENPGVPITRQEALAISQRTIETAEKERLDLVEADARRGIQYND